MHVEIEFSGRENIASDGTGRRSADSRDLPFQDRIRIFLIANLKGSVLLELLDHCASHKHLNAGNERLVPESRHRDRVHILKIIWFYRPNMIAEATTQTATDNNRRE